MSTPVQNLVDDAAQAIGDPNKQRVQTSQWISIYNRSNRELCQKVKILRFLDKFTLEAAQTRYDLPEGMVQMNGIHVTETPSDETTVRWIHEIFEDEFRRMTTNLYPTATLPDSYFCSSNWFYLVPSATAQIVGGACIDYFGLPDRVADLSGVMQVDDLAQDYLIRRMTIHGMEARHRLDEAKTALDMWNADLQGLQDKLEDRSNDRRSSVARRTRRFSGMR
jgi:hypothetical protein